MRGSGSAAVADQVVETVELYRVAMPLRSPFRSSRDRTVVRELILVHVIGDQADGWGECVAPSAPTYTAEYACGAAAVLTEHLLPRLAGGRCPSLELAGRLAPVRGHPMAKAALEVAWLDAELRAACVSASEWLGLRRSRVPAGVAVGMPGDAPPETAAERDRAVDALLEEVEGHLAAGYRAVKVKIAPGFDLAPLVALRDRFGPALDLGADANGAYTRAGAEALVALDDLGLAYLEQPLEPEDLLGSAALQRVLRTPVCLDESLSSPAAAMLAFELGAGGLASLKAGRLGGLVATLRLAEWASSRGVGCRAGGMLETGVGRALAVVVAALDACNVVGELSASDRYFAEDLAGPFCLDEGQLSLPPGPGFGVTPFLDVLRERTVARQEVRLA